MKLNLFARQDGVETAWAVVDPVLGGGDAKLLKVAPPDVRLGDNANAFTGGFRLWSSASPRKRRRVKTT
ncbi:MAG: hypothetical protein A2Y95_08015 [Deltaproteobacteria bacterium RBG_13_65_10]|nr:MAG: hypothetical protein A2Y95_08015 [Deltaproteobacteria bacterium RBG_13_65_10]